jgi:hypothetical protein
MDYALKRPCANCPFRHDIPPFLRSDRAEDILATLDSGGTFACHKTVEYADDDDGDTISVNEQDQQHCAGALILMEHQHDGRGDGPGCHKNQMARFASRFSGFNPNELDMEAPVFVSYDAMIEAQEM